MIYGIACTTLIGHLSFQLFFITPNFTFVILIFVNLSKYGWIKLFICWDADDSFFFLSDLISFYCS